MSGLYHEGSRGLQDRFDSRRIADRLEGVTLRAAFSASDRELIASCPMFFLATADAEGRPDCSYKGGEAGFVRVVGERTLAFPSYDGNGMFKSLGNLLVNPWVGMLFIDFEKGRRLRVNGKARIEDDDPLVSDYPGAQLMVRVEAVHIFPNCPRYIHQMRMVETSPYVPRQGHTPPEPEWKRMEEFRDALPKRE